MSFAQARQRLFEVSDALAASAAERSGREHLLEAAGSLRMPEVAIEARALRFQKTLELPLGSLAPVAEEFGIGDPLRFGENDTRFRPILSASLPIYSGGRIPAAQRAARAAIAQSEADGQRQRNALMTQLVRAYFGQQLAQRAAAVRREVRDGLARHYDNALALEREGMATRAQRLQAEVARDRAARELEQAEHEALAAQEILALLLRHEGAVRPATPLFVASAPLAARDAFVRQAQASHPGLAGLQALAAQAAENVRIQQAALKPQVFAFAQVDLYRDDALLTESDWAFGIGLRYAFWSGANRPAQIAAARARQEQTEHSFDEAREQVAQAVTQAWHALDAARSRFLLLDSAMAEATENVRLQELSFREGEATSLDVIDARLNLGAARIERDQAAWRFDVALAELLEASGQSERFEEFLRSADQVLPE